MRFCDIWNNQGRDSGYHPELRLRSIILTEALIILEITKNKSNNYTLNEKKDWKSQFCFFTDGEQHKKCKLDMIILRNHAHWSYMT